MQNSGNNSDKMTLEAKLVLAIKNHALSEFISDDDAIETLAKRAIADILNKPIIYKDSHGREREGDSPVSKAATETAHKICHDMVDKFINDEEIQTKIRQAIFDMLPLVVIQKLDGYVSNMMYNFASKTSETAINNLRALGRI